MANEEIIFNTLTDVIKDSRGRTTNPTINLIKCSILFDYYSHSISMQEIFIIQLYAS